MGSNLVRSSVAIRGRTRTLLTEAQRIVDRARLQIRDTRARCLHLKTKTDESVRRSRDLIAESKRR